MKLGALLATPLGFIALSLWLTWRSLGAEFWPTIGPPLLGMATMGSFLIVASVLIAMKS